MTRAAGNHMMVFLPGQSLGRALFHKSYLSLKELVSL
jgi:hypothetical protein